MMVGLERNYGRLRTGAITWHWPVFGLRTLRLRSRASGD